MDLAALDTFAERMQQTLTDAGQEAGPDLDATTIAFFDAVIDLYCSGEARGCLVLSTAPAEAAHDDDIREKLAGVLAGIEREIAVRIREAVARGATVRDEAARTQVYLGQFATLALQARAGVPAPQLRAGVRLLVTATAGE
ncbi:hypothetical protein ACTU3I_12180 [Microbacterium sp. RD1]|uniref:hypothetical protein n=1 Tax=Microbacterium sp. RD1 TaxID=3457313 RepID=UPI003FA5BBB3